jgi:hypothetical protein
MAHVLTVQCLTSVGVATRHARVFSWPGCSPRVKIARPEDRAGAGGPGQGTCLEPAAMIFWGACATQNWTSASLR